MNKLRKTLDNAHLGPLVDQLGNLNAQIAGLEAAAKEIKDVLRAHVGKSIPGSLFSATILEQRRESLDREAVEKFYKRYGKALPLKESVSIQVRLHSLKG